MLTLGSLFDGSGGFPLAALHNGIKPIWASEIEPYPILVTHKRLPNVKHYGDISKINGAELEPVDIITGGSPCTNLSIAGNRKGLKGEQSYLFYEMIRIIKEMREATNGKYPKYAVWENVPGAFSSNRGEDFRAVLNEFCRIKDRNVSVPRPPKGKWLKAGEILADTYSISWRTLDSQYFGVPQRRKRIYLIADFTGGGSSEILFKSESLPRDFGQMPKQTQRTSTDAEKSLGKSDKFLFENHGKDFRYKGPIKNCTTISASYGTGGNNQPFVVTTSKASFHLRANENRVNTLVSTDYKDPPILYSIQGNMIGRKDENISFTLNATDNHAVSDEFVVRRITPLECCRLQGFPDWWTQDLVYNEDDLDEETIKFFEDVFEEHRQTLNPDKKPKTRKQIIKWLTHEHSDADEYKMWGNGIALPCAEFVFESIVKQTRY